ncbi:molybdate ABC transporter substrate-binding protein [Sulfitobacter sp. HNIBRBA2951]|uniref:molybdate ABC transporter substrate-binding protein n=1 Tax=Sulfitobacter aquimarinus TaxID=3158557 RepID=UPI0032DF4E14
MRMFLALLLTLAPLALGAQPVTVFAAASLRGALSEIAHSYDADVTLSFAGSGTLARQVAAGAPVDVVVLAHPEWMDWLEGRGLTKPATRVDVAGGRLVLIGPAGASTLEAPDTDTLRMALGNGRLAIGQRDAVPAGSYARDWLRHIGAWEAMIPHLAETDNVRAALALVAAGAAPLGVVYASDAAAEPRVSLRYAIPADTHAPIRYPAAATTDAGRGFLDHLQSSEARAIFTAHGFAP